MRLLIHHHAAVYRDDEGALWLPAFIGRWIEEIARRVTEVRLLLYQTANHLPHQDTCLTAPNIRLYSLGAPGKTWDRLARMRRLQAACREASSGADGLLIRGITPRQLAIYRACAVPHKALLLVGSLHNPPPPFRLSLGGMYSTWMHRQRPRELAAMRGITWLANAPQLVTEIADMLHQPAHFVPTNSIRRSEFAPLTIRPVGQVWRLLFCGRVVAEKGIEELLHALLILYNSGQPCHLHIVGTGEPAYQQQLQAWLRTHPLENAVTWHGLIPYGAALFAHYQQADVMVLPSHSEGFPHVIWEAAAQGCPVIASRVGGIPALWEGYGTLIPPQDVPALAAAIQEVCTDAALRASIIQQAYEYAQGFTVEACAEHLITTLSKEWHDVR